MRKFCDICGSKLETVDIPRDWGYNYFNEKTGKRTIDHYQLCFNNDCKTGQENLCKYVNGGHFKHPKLLLIPVSILIIFLGMLGILGENILTLAFILVLPVIILFDHLADCRKCPYKNYSGDFI